MINDKLLQYFIDNYYPWQEIVYRLPASVPIADFWPEELRLRRCLSVSLPLRAADNGSFWYVPTKKFLLSGDTLADLARSQDSVMQTQLASEEGIIDEAFYSSSIEGAFSTRIKARKMIQSGRPPETKDERMILNNYNALRFALDHLDVPINEALTLEIASILTDGTLDKGTKPGWRDGPVYILSGRQDIVYTAPSADRLPPMLDDLFSFIEMEDIHPVVKACVVHIYFVTVHPLFDGNGRTARALAYMILLRSGYDFFRQIPVSGLLAKERPRYYKAIRASQDTANGNDFTYFIEYYADMLCRSAADIHRRISQAAKIEQLKNEASSLAGMGRLTAGLEWLYARDPASVTTEKWKEKFAVSFETARKDLIWLSDHGYLVPRSSGHKHFFDVPKDQ